MLTVRELKPRLYELVLTDTVTAADIGRMKAALVPALKDGGPMGLIVHLEELDDITGDTLIADARFEFAMLPHWAKVKKGAVITDKQAFEALLNWFDPILPMIAVRTFAPDQAAEAEAWAAPVTDNAKDAGPGLRVIADGDDGLLVFDIDGKLTEDDADRAFAAFDRAVERRGRVNLMVRVTDYEGFDLGLLFDRDTMGAKFAAIGKIGRYAIVGAPGWMRGAVQAMSPLLPLEMRSFERSEEAAARRWASGG